MTKHSYRLAYIVIAVIAAATLMGYLGRPPAGPTELVSPRQELPNYQEHFPGDTSLSDQLVKSYGLAMVLVQTPYTLKNVTALESLRSWARTKFQQQPDFLHPVSLPPVSASSQTFLAAVYGNLFSGVTWWLQEQVGHVLQWRIAAFHDTKAYLSFRNAYYDLFGLTADAAVLLARYQSDRAQQASSVILWSLLWLSGAAASIVAIVKTRPALRFETAHKALSWAWIIAAFCYVSLSLSSNQLAYLVSGMVA